MKRSFLTSTILLLASLSLLLGCTTEDEVLKGGQGEFCSGRDDDCRAGLVCLEGVCDAGEESGVYTCTEICAKMDTCDAELDTCLPDCRTTITGWSEGAKDSFAICMVENLTCAEAQQEFAPQICYSRIPLPDDKRLRCDEFAAVVAGCDSFADTAPLLQQCYALGRTGTDEAWAETDRCASAIETGICSGIGTCLNEVFGLNLQLPDDFNNLNNIAVGLRQL